MAHYFERGLSDLAPILSGIGGSGRLWSGYRTRRVRERGVPAGYLQRLARRWSDAFDWRAQEALINRHDQVMLETDGQKIHAFHVRSRHPEAMRLVLLHGWPSSGVEYLGIIDALVDPAAHGGRPEDAFHLIVPTLPGFGLSPPPTAAGWTSARIAPALVALLDGLGYDRFGVHATDMGSDVAGHLDTVAPGRAIGLHFGTDTDTIVAVASFMGGDLSGNDALSAEQKARVAALMAALPDRNGYLAIQSTRPKTLGYGLHDSPVGQLAWITEKFEAWTNPGKPTIEAAVDIDQFLTNVSLYWFGGGGAGSANAIWESFKAMGWSPPSATPRGVAVFNADDLARPLMDPGRQLVHWTEHRDGGHFPAMEVPDLLAADLRRFFGNLRG